MKSVTCLCLAPIAVLALLGSVCAADELERRATWSIPATADVKARLDDYLATKTLDEAARLKIEALWPDEAQPLDGGELLDRLTLRWLLWSRKLPGGAMSPRPGAAVHQFDAFGESLPPLVRDNLRLSIAAGS
jgi:hypothetical protein